MDVTLYEYALCFEFGRGSLDFNEADLEDTLGCNSA